MPLVFKSLLSAERSDQRIYFRRTTLDEPRGCQRGSYPIHGAFIVGDVEAAKILVAAGANPGELNGDGLTPIEAAVGRKDDPIVAAALEDLAELSSDALKSLGL